jgi:hypothetical protein
MDPMNKYLPTRRTTTTTYLKSDAIDIPDKFDFDDEEIGDKLYRIKVVRALNKGELKIGKSHNLEFVHERNDGQRR